MVRELLGLAGGGAVHTFGLVYFMKLGGFFVLGKTTTVRPTASVMLAGGLIAFSLSTAANVPVFEKKNRIIELQQFGKV